MLFDRPHTADGSASCESRQPSAPSLLSSSLNSAESPWNTLGLYGSITVLYSNWLKGLSSARESGGVGWSHASLGAVGICPGAKLRRAGEYSAEEVGSTAKIGRDLR
jgi:hypothetical protein